MPVQWYQFHKERGERVSVLFLSLWRWSANTSTQLGCKLLEKEVVHSSDWLIPTQTGFSTFERTEHPFTEVSFFLFSTAAPPTLKTHVLSHSTRFPLCPFSFRNTRFFHSFFSFQHQASAKKIKNLFTHFFNKERDYQNHSYLNTLYCI